MYIRYPPKMFSALHIPGWDQGWLIFVFLVFQKISNIQVHKHDSLSLNFVESLRHYSLPLLAQSMTMGGLQTRALGRDGPQVSAIGFGAMGLSGFYGPVESEEERLAFLDEAYQLGERFWDTADIYEDSEVLIGKWCRRSGHRDDVFIATKFGQSKEGIHAIRSDAEYAHSACERSLQRLGVEQIDLFYCHRLDRKTPIEETVKAMVELKKYVAM